MRYAVITAGSGSFYCGSCMRDNTLARALHARGDEATLLPLYMPLKVEEPSHAGQRIFYGGINVYLEQYATTFQRTLGPLERLLDSPWLLRKVSAMTSAE